MFVRVGWPVQCDFRSLSVKQKLWYRMCEIKIDSDNHAQKYTWVNVRLTEITLVSRNPRDEARILSPDLGNARRI